MGILRNGRRCYSLASFMTEAPIEENGSDQISTKFILPA